MNSAFLDNYFNHNPNFKRSPQAIHLNSTEKPQFKKLRQFGNSSLEIDQTRGIALIKWVGKVDINVAKKLIFSTINASEFSSCNKILLDQSNLVEFSTETRVWLKFFLKNNAKRFRTKLLKLGSIKPQTPSGLLFSNFASEILKSEMPNLRRKRFETFDQASTWLED